MGGGELTHKILTSCPNFHKAVKRAARICAILENSGNILNRSFLCIVSSISETCSLIHTRNESSRTKKTKKGEKVV